MNKTFIVLGASIASGAVLTLWVLLPAVTGLVFAQPVTIVTVPFVALTHHSHKILPTVAASQQTPSPKSAGTQIKKDAKVTKTEVPPVLNFKMKSLTGQDVDLSRYQGKVVLMVNVASKCGFTPQYKGLEELHKKYAEKGLAILGFPANDFGKQEPGTDPEIGEFCKKNYGVDFDMFSKVVVTGDDKTPLYKLLTSEDTDPKFPGEVKWNFEKFLISRDGQIVNRFRSNITPDSDEMVKAIEAELDKK